MREQDVIDPIKVGWICDWPEPPKLHATGEHPSRLVHRYTPTARVGAAA